MSSKSRFSQLGIKVLKMIERQNELLRSMERHDRNMAAGPLTKLLIHGRVDMLNWFLTIQSDKSLEESTSSLDSRVMQMLHKQKDLLQEPIDEEILTLLAKSKYKAESKS
jgi:hypothetical protein